MRGPEEGRAVHHYRQYWGHGVTVIGRGDCPQQGTSSHGQGRGWIGGYNALFYARPFKLLISQTFVQTIQKISSRLA